MLKNPFVSKCTAKKNQFVSNWIAKDLSRRFESLAELTTIGREERWRSIKPPFQLDHCINKNKNDFLAGEWKERHFPLLLHRSHARVRREQGCLIHHHFILFATLKLPYPLLVLYMEIYPPDHTLYSQVLVRHSFRSSRLAELSVVKGEVSWKICLHLSQNISLWRKCRKVTTSVLTISLICRWLRWSELWIAIGWRWERWISLWIESCLRGILNSIDPFQVKLGERRGLVPVSYLQQQGEVEVRTEQLKIYDL